MLVKLTKGGLYWFTSECKYHYQDSMKYEPFKVWLVPNRHLLILFQNFITMLFFSKRGNCEKCKYPCTRTLLHTDDETLKLSLLRVECQDLIMITHMWSLINDVILKKESGIET